MGACEAVPRDPGHGSGRLVPYLIERVPVNGY